MNLISKLSQSLQPENLETTKDTLMNFVRGERSRNLQLGIWGTTGAGKSTYLAVLYQELLRTKHWRPAVPDPKASRYLNQLLEALQTGNFPPPNAENKLDIYEYQVTSTEDHPHFKNLTVTLKFIDAPGRFYEEPAKGVGKVAGMDILDYMCGCDGIIFLLDPERPEHRRKLSFLLLELMQEFQKRSIEGASNKQVRPLEQYMAFCVTKTDQDTRLWEDSSTDGSPNPMILPSQLVKEIVGNAFYESLIQTFCHKERFQFFPVSAVGRYREGGISKSPIYTPNSESSGNQPLYSPDTGWNYDVPQPIPTIEDNFGFDPIAPDSTQSESSAQRKIDVSKDPRPLNVLEAVEWLITGIQQKPPILPPRKSTQPMTY